MTDEESPTKAYRVENDEGVNVIPNSPTNPITSKNDFKKIY